MTEDSFITMAAKHGLNQQTTDSQGRHRFQRENGRGLHQVKFTDNMVGNSGWFDKKPTPAYGITVRDHRNKERRCWLYTDKSGQEHRVPLTEMGHVWIKWAVDHGLFGEILYALERER